MRIFQTEPVEYQVALQDAKGNKYKAFISAVDIKTALKDAVDLAEGGTVLGIVQVEGCDDCGLSAHNAVHMDAGRQADEDFKEGRHKNPYPAESDQHRLYERRMAAHQAAREGERGE